MDFIFENLDDILELLLEAVKAVFHFVRKRLLPLIAGLIESIRHREAVRSFNDEVEIKSEDTFDKKQ